MKEMKYLRIQVRYSGKTGKPVGIFGAVHHLMTAGALNPEEIKLFQEIEAWFEEYLPNPPFYNDGNPDKAITYFKNNKTLHMLEKLIPLLKILEKYEVPYDVVYTNFPGRVIYEDDFQVAVI
ncbi:MAG: hypothetical protein A2Y33_14560 [Spirochaetes bacterium GWF1_51_8]|nr:MAG: hypothetical protein A2Y33_14560 [Spirochaetes bacterium GWF1_51_8]